MAGFLSRLEKKGTRGSTVAADLLVQSAGRQASSGNSQAIDTGTGVYQADASLGAIDDLLAELKAEGKAAKQENPTSAERSDSHSGLRSGATKVRIVQSADSSARIKKKKPDIFDESLPWWLTEPSASTPHVDQLVPAARRALNDLLSENFTRDELADAIKKAVAVAAEKLSAEIRFSSKDIHDSIHELTSLMMGKGPLQALYDDPAVTDIYLDRFDSIKCVRRGQALETPFRFRSRNEYDAYVSGMLQSVDRVLNMTSPIVDCVLADQWRSRINAVHSSLLDGPDSSLVLRIPRMQQISFYDLLRTKTLPATLAAWLAELVSCGEANILVIGPTGSGKTTMTTALLSAVGSDERIVTIEDVPEIFVPTSHIEKLVSRPDNAQGEGAIGIDHLLRAALRRAPHRIVVGEIRDKEGPLFLKALETGHMGSVATIHAEGGRDGLWRLLDVVQAHEKSPQESIQRRIARSLHVLVSMRKINGRPCLMEVTEVLPPIGGEFVIRQLVKFDGEAHGKRQWRIMSAHSEWVDRLAARGMELQAGPALLPVEKGDERKR